MRPWQYSHIAMASLFVTCLPIQLHLLYVPKLTSGTSPKTQMGNIYLPSHWECVSLAKIILD